MEKFFLKKILEKVKIGRRIISLLDVIQALDPQVDVIA